MDTVARGSLVARASVVVGRPRALLPRVPARHLTMLKPGLMRRAAAEFAGHVRARVRRLRGRRDQRHGGRRARADRDRGDVRAHRHGDDLRDRPPLRRAHQPGGDDRLHVDTPLPRPRCGRLHRRAVRGGDGRRAGAARRLAHQAGLSGGYGPDGGGGHRAALRGAADRDLDVRDHGGGDRHPRGRSRCRDRDRRDRRAGHPHRRPD